MAQVPDSDGSLGGARSLTHGREGCGGVGGRSGGGKFARAMAERPLQHRRRSPDIRVEVRTWVTAIVNDEVCVSTRGPLACVNLVRIGSENNPVCAFEALAQLSRIRFTSVPLVRLGSVTSNPKICQASKQVSKQACMQACKHARMEASKLASKRASEQASKARQQASKR